MLLCSKLLIILTICGFLCERESDTRWGWGWLQLRKVNEGEARIIVVDCYTWNAAAYFYYKSMNAAA